MVSPVRIRVPPLPLLSGLFQFTAGYIDADLPAGRGYSGQSGKPLIEIARVHHAMWVMFTETRCSIEEYRQRCTMREDYITVVYV
jgi:hypothetical protein